MDTIKELFEDLKLLLPCNKCQEAYTKHLNALPIPARRDSIFKWLYELHHKVNMSQQSPAVIDTPPYREVLQTWKGERGIEKGKQNGWRFLFFLAMTFPPLQHKERRGEYREALKHWMVEVSKTLWREKGTAPTCTDLHTKKAFLQWLMNEYKAQHQGQNPPTYFLKDPMKTCAKQCKI